MKSLKIGLFPQYYYYLVLFCLLLAFSFLRGFGFAGLLFANIGSIHLNSSFNNAISASNHLQQSQRWLRLSLQVPYNENNQSSLRKLGFAFAYNEKDADAALAWQKSGLTEMQQEFLSRGDQAFGGKNFDQALQFYTWGSLIEPELGDWDYYQARVFRKMNRYPDALEELNHASGKSLFAVGESDIYSETGWLKLDHGSLSDYEEALLLFEQALVKAQFVQTSQLDAYYGHAEALRKTQAFELAISEYESLLNRQPDHYEANVILSILYWQIEANVLQAEQRLQHAIQLRPTNIWAYQRLAILYEETERYDDALKQYQIILRHDPQNELANNRIKNLVNNER